MSEQPKRTVADIQKEYQDGCLKVGHLQYQIYVLTCDLALQNQSLRDLNIEAANLKQTEDTAPAKESA